MNNLLLTIFIQIVISKFVKVSPHKLTNSLLEKLLAGFCAAVCYNCVCKVDPISRFCTGAHLTVFDLTDRDSWFTTRFLIFTTKFCCYHEPFHDKVKKNQWNYQWIYDIQIKNESYHNSLNTELLILFLFLYWFFPYLSILFAIEPTNIKNGLLEFPKNFLVNKVSLRPATLLKINLVWGFSCKISQIFNNIFFAIQLCWLLLKTIINCSTKCFERSAVLWGGWDHTWRGLVL